jgi:hypothetical protein
MEKIEILFYMYSNYSYKQSNEQMTTTMTASGLPTRMTDEDYETEFSTTPTTTIGTPRPGMDAEDAAERQLEADKAIWTFSHAAKQAAVLMKRRRSPKSSTSYRMSASARVQRAFNELEKTNEMSPADFKLLKEAFGNYRVKLHVHDSKTLDELRRMQAATNEQEDAAELAMQATFKDKEADAQTYIDAKDKYLDLKAWNAELTKEIRSLEPKPKYANMGGGLFRNMPNVVEPAGVPSQHAQISQASAERLRTVLTPETLRRTFISHKSLTVKISEEVTSFLTHSFLADDQRIKDRAEVVKQIKSWIMAAKAASKNKQF